ncbi:spindle pole body formation-associated protein-domain-containing protein [Hypoxylon sp. NC1633]|nr:spindle pole body formation-associated protein-domain-containing protein [Hypoxylon sp. NC1633]
MLGWALKKGFQGATGAKDASDAAEADTTQFEAPDTPAPVFAARAFKNAIFGASSKSDTLLTTDQNQVEPMKDKNDITADTKADSKTGGKTGSKTGSKNDSKNDNKTGSKNDHKSHRAIPKDTMSPSKQSPSKPPTSILMTPGTGTARRKRVSFNHDVKAGSGIDSSPLVSARQRKRTTLQRALENSRSENSKRHATKVEDVPELPTDDESADEWEDDAPNQDITVDLNEPHSESGKYWKGEFNRYRDEAIADIQKLVKFKALAKSYAKKKDAEALDLAQKLAEAQMKIVQMEENSTTATKTAGKGKGRRGNGHEDATLAKDLAEQTDLVTHYREKVKELGALLEEHQGRSQPDRRQIDTSPRTERTLLEVNRELRLARSELKQMDKLRGEVKKLKSDLRVKEREENRLKEASHSMQEKKLEEHLRIVKGESRKKDEEISKLKKDYDSLKRDAKLRTAEALQVLEEKNNKIAQLEKTIKALEAENTSSRTTQDLKANIESLGKPSKYDRLQTTHHSRRSTSVEVMDLGATPKPLPAEDEPEADDVFPQIPADAYLPADWSSSYKDIRTQLQEEKRKKWEADKREMESILENPNTPPSPESSRFMINVRSSRLNHSPTKGRSLRQAIEEGYIKAPVAAGRQADDADMFGALENLAPRLTNSRSHRDRPLSGSEAPHFDLAQDKFAPLGDTEPEHSSSANTSRNTMPPERRAAAKARLEQKKLMRQKNDSGRSRDKENVRP